MRRVRVLSVCVLSLVLFSFGYQRINYRHGMYKNVCKDLKNEALVYFIFVDTKETSPWTEFDIRSTLDSVNTAISWLNNEAIKNNISLKIRANYYIGNPYTTVKRNLPQGTVEKTLTSSGLHKGLADLNLWADAIAKKVGASFNVPDKDGIPEIQNPKNKERLISLLRDDNKVESVALIFMVNNYYRSDISLPINIYSNNDVEFAIVSYKYSSEIAHNILALYGAAPMYNSIYRKKTGKIDILQKYFPNDIMQDPYARNINSLSIGDYTRYLIGWQDKLDPKYNELLTDALVKF